MSPFKLTAEMVQVMGGDINSPLYKEYSELCVKAYLAVRPYAEEIVELVSLMMDSSLPCFKGELYVFGLIDICPDFASCQVKSRFESCVNASN